MIGQSLTSALDRLSHPQRSTQTLWLFLSSHLLIWTVYSSVTRSNLDRWGDMAENFAWGQEWQLGYFKHPPLFAWVTAAWFEVFPNADWAYFLLSQLNVVIGFLAIWLLAKMFLSERHALIAVLLLEFVPFYTFLSIKFNADTVLLSLWPLTTLFFCRAYLSRRLGASLLFGAFAALALLSKYYSFSLLAALFLISIVCKERKQYYVSSSPYLSVAALLILVAPHFLWLVSVDFLPLRYATDHIIDNPIQIMAATGTFAGAQGLYLLLMALVFMALVGMDAIRRPRRLQLDDSKRMMIFGIGVFPFLLTISGALLLRIELSPIWGLPMWFFVGASCLTYLGLQPLTSHVRRGVALVFAFQFLIVLLSPCIALGMELSRAEIWTSPRKELAVYVSDTWHRRFDAPLTIVAGSKPYADSISFYADEHPSLFIDFDYRISPWISEERVRTEGLAVVCLRADQQCIDSANERFGAGDERVDAQISSRRSIISDPEPVDFVIVLIRPVQTGGGMQLSFGEGADNLEERSDRSGR